MPEQISDKLRLNIEKGWEKELVKSKNQPNSQLDEPVRIDLDIKTQKGKEQDWARKMRLAQQAAKLGKYGAYATGQTRLARALGDISEASEAGASAEGETPEETRKIGSNLAGRQAGIMAKRRGMAGGKSAALGGAVAGALQGEGVADIGKNAISWYLLWIAFGALFTLYGSIPALIYLDFHYLMSKFGSKIFGEMFFWQKIVLALANILFIVAVLILIIILIIVYCGLNPLSCGWLDIESIHEVIKSYF